MNSLLSRNNNIQSVVLLLLVSIIVLLSLNMSWVSADAAYYLSIARDIANGAVPYGGIKMHYTPLMMYLNSILYIVIAKPSYNTFLILQILLIATTGLVLFKVLLKIFHIKKNVALYVAVLYVIAVLASDGTYIVLEPYSSLAIIAGFFFFFRRKFVVAGFLVGLSFFVKQYGILNFIPLYVYLVHGIIKQQYTWRAVVNFSLGGILSLFLFLLLFLFYYQVPFSELLSQLSGTEYGHWAASNSSSIVSYFIGVKNLILLVAPLVAWYLSPQSARSVYVYIMVLGVMINMLPTFVKSYQHYLINVYPYLFVLIGIQLNNLEYRLKTYKISYFVIAIFLMVFLVNRTLKYRHHRDDQLSISEKASAVLDRGSTVYVQGNLRYLYFLNDYRNPVLEDTGYSYMVNDVEKNIIKISLSDKLSGEVTDAISLSEKDSIYVYNRKVF